MELWETTKSKATQGCSLWMYMIGDKKYSSAMDEKIQNFKMSARWSILSTFLAALINSILFNYTRTSLIIVFVLFVYLCYIPDGNLVEVETWMKGINDKWLFITGCAVCSITYLRQSSVLSVAPWCNALFENPITCQPVKIFMLNICSSQLWKLRWRVYGMWQVLQAIGFPGCDQIFA